MRHQFLERLLSVLGQVTEALSDSLITFLLIFEGGLTVVQGGGLRPQGHLHGLLVRQQSLVVGGQEGEVDIRGELEDILEILSVVTVGGLHPGQILELLHPGPGGRVLRPDHPAVGNRIQTKLNNILPV